VFEVDKSKLGAACSTVLIRIAVAAVDLLACWFSLSVDLIGIYRMGRNGFAMPPSHPLQPRGLVNPFFCLLLFHQCSFFSAGEFCLCIHLGRFYRLIDLNFEGMATKVNTLRCMVEHKHKMDVNRIGSYVSRCREDLWYGTSGSYTALESRGGLWIFSMSKYLPNEEEIMDMFYVKTSVLRLLVGIFHL
jgi:hypothetical protein